MKAAPKTLGRVELIALLAMLAATLAFAIDAMLPAIPEIGTALSPETPNRAQLVIATFVAGMGLGTFFAGPLSDAFGRKPIGLYGLAIYIAAALYASVAPSLEAMLIARFVQGLGASGPRVVGMAVVRDLFSGRQMARILSFIIFVFTLAPIFAPSIGWVIAYLFGWQAIFLSFALFGGIAAIWLSLRLAETLEVENRRPFRLGKLVEGTLEVFRNRTVVLTMLVQTLVFGVLFSALMSSQQVFDQVFGRGEHFPLWIGLMSLLAATSNLLNAAIVVRFGMHKVVSVALLAVASFALLFLIAQQFGLAETRFIFPVGFLFYISLFYLAGLAIGNLNAMALEPMGHMAGLAASIVTAIATIGSALVAVPIGQAFDGTIQPLTIGVLALTATGFMVMRWIPDYGAD